MLKVPMNHKTIFLFDHAGYFSNSCEQPIEFDAAAKSKTQQPQQFNNASSSKLNPLYKSLWTCNVESVLEYSRIVYDLFPENKLIRLMVTKLDTPLNSWHESEQGLEHLMNIMGNIQAPTPQTRELFENEEFINLCKALNICLSSIAQLSDLQKTLIQKSKSPSNSEQQITSSGRIILFTSAKLRNLDQLQVFLSESIQKYNKDFDASVKNDKSVLSLLTKVSTIELMIIDAVPCEQPLSFEKEIFKQNSNELRTRMVSCKSGNHLPLKLIEYVQKFYELGVTSITNIPMKEELNANSSANYDVDILHSRSLHDQLKICGLIKNCLIKKDLPSTVCLKWNNPKTNITEFNFSSCSYRITPIDVNSRPASCLTSFLLSGRCVVLEVPLPRASTNTRIQSHVLCTHGNEIFMHSLNFGGKANLEDMSDKMSIENLGDKLSTYRSNEFNELIKDNSVLQYLNPNDNDNIDVKKVLGKFEKITRRWPVCYSSTIITNLVEIKPLIKAVCQETITDLQYNECIKCIEYLKAAEIRNEPLKEASLCVPVEDASFLRRKDVFKTVWTELESYVKCYQDISDRHRILYNHIRNMLLSTIKTESASRNLDMKRTQPVANKSHEFPAPVQPVNYQFENEKLNKRKKILFESTNATEEASLLDIWNKNLNEEIKSRKEFYGRLTYPNQIAQLYTHLKLDESVPTKNSSAKIEIS